MHQGGPGQQSTSVTKATMKHVIPSMAKPSIKSSSRPPPASPRRKGWAGFPLPPLSIQHQQAGGQQSKAWGGGLQQVPSLPPRLTNLRQVSNVVRSTGRGGAAPLSCRWRKQKGHCAPGEVEGPRAEPEDKWEERQENRSEILWREGEEKRRGVK